MIPVAVFFGITLGNVVTQCAAITLAFSAASERTVCRLLSIRREEERTDGYRWHVLAHADGNDNLYLTIVNVERNRVHDALWERVGWIINEQDTKRRASVIIRKIEDFVAAVKMDEPLCDAAFKIVARTSDLVAYDPVTNVCRDKKTSKTIDCVDAQIRFVAEGPRQKHYIKAVSELNASMGHGRRFYRYLQTSDNARSIGEISAVLLGGFGLYQALIDLNRQDFDYGFTWSLLKKKYSDLSGVRFDNNNFYINMGHAPEGAWFYSIARTNNKNIFESYLVAIAASFAWETLVEYREIVSINDMFTTPFAGAALGEVMFQFGDYFQSGSNTILNYVLRGVFGHVREFDSWAFKNRPRRNLNVDELGFSLDAFHDFKLFAGVGTSTRGGVTLTDRFESEVRAQGEIINIPLYDRPGKISGRLLLNGNFTEFAAKTAIGVDGVNEFLFFARAALAGYYRQSVKKDPRGYNEGYSFFVGAATAFDMSVQRGPSFMDQLGIVNVLGPTIDTVFFYKGFRIRTTFEVFGDFATIRSFAFERWAAQNPELIDPSTGEIRNLRSVLAKEANYFGYGITGAAKLILNYKNLELGAKWRGDTIESIDARDRKAEYVSDYSHMSEQRSEVQVWGVLRMPHTRWAVGFNLAEIYRTGDLKDVVVERTDKRFTGYGVYEF
jgi:hypothetical protein